MSNDYKHAVILGDIHFPFHDRETIRLALKYINKRKPDLIVQIGDLYDNFNYSRFYKSPDIISPRTEMVSARKLGVELWKELQAASPKAKCVQILGNHDRVRLEKLALNLAPPLAHLVVDKIMELLTFDKVTTLDSDRESFSAMVQGEYVNFMHGCFSTTIAHARHYMSNVVLGHLHRGELMPFHHINKDLWALNVGYMGNPNAPVFNYTRTVLKDWTLGMGVIDIEGPKFLSKRVLRRLSEKQ